MLTDPIADYLTRIRNALGSGHDEVQIPASKLKVEMSRLLKEQGYILDYAKQPARVGEEIKIRLKYTEDRRPVITGLERISRPGRRRYVDHKEVPRVDGGTGTAILSTSVGVMTGHEARAKGVGGEVVAYVWGAEMSRIGRKPISVPESVTIDVSPGHVSVKGPKGELAQDLSADMKVEQSDGVLTVARPTDRGEHRALHGLTRSLIANMVEGVTEGFEKRLEIQGVGYRAQLKGKNLELALGYSHPVSIEAPEGIEFEVPQQTEIIVRGIDKQLVGQVAADIRKRRPPEPYKGKGIRYRDEHVMRKVGKRA